MPVIKQKNADYDQICSRLFCSHVISDRKTIHWITKLAKNPFNYKLCQLAELRKRLQTCKSSCVQRWIIDCNLQITNEDEIAQKCFWYTLIKKGENFKQKHTLMTYKLCAVWTKEHTRNLVLDVDALIEMIERLYNQIFIKRIWQTYWFLSYRA